MLGQPTPKRRCSKKMLLVNVWICLTIIIFQQEPSLKQIKFEYSALFSATVEPNQLFRLIVTGFTLRKIYTTTKAESMG